MSEVRGSNKAYNYNATSPPGRRRARVSPQHDHRPRYSTQIMYSATTYSHLRLNLRLYTLQIWTQHTCDLDSTAHYLGSSGAAHPGPQSTVIFAHTHPSSLKARDHAVPRGHCVADADPRAARASLERGHGCARPALELSASHACTAPRGFSRGPLGGLSCSLDKVLLGLLYRKFHRHLGRLGRLVHRAELGCIGDGGAQRGLERRATRRRVRALVDALLRWE